MGKRFTLAVTLALALFSSLTPAEAQQAGRVYRIGVLYGTTPTFSDAVARAFMQGLGEQGYIVGENVHIEFRSAEGRWERLRELATELVQLRADLIYAPSTQAAVAAKQATSSVPIVTCCVTDAVGLGLIASFARPGGNLTGTTWDVTPEIAGKLVQLLREAVPKVPRAAIFWNSTQPGTDLFLREAQMAGRSLGVSLQPVDVQSPSEFKAAFARITKDRAEALIVFSDLMAWVNRKPLIKLAAEHRLPAMYGAREFVDDGGLMSYGPNANDLHRRAASYVAKILKGAKPADLPVEQPTKFELVINPKTAKALGLTIPPALLLRADRLVE